MTERDVSPKFTVTDARALILGSDGGIGSALREALISRGCEVLGVPGPAGGFDITDPTDRARIREISSGGVDLVVFAAGLVGFSPLAAAPDREVARLLEVNLTAPLLLTSQLLPVVRDGGYVVFITGAVVDVPTIAMAHYTASKAGLSAAVRVLRRELRSRRIGVLDARPPHTETLLAQHPLFGSAPRLSQGLDPAVVARRIIAGVEHGAEELRPADFSATDTP